MYNQSSSETGTCMPLLMGYTQPEKIQEAEKEEAVAYDQKSQIAVVNPFVMRILGTKCMKGERTGNKGNPDMKNVIDDQKQV